MSAIRKNITISAAALQQAAELKQKGYASTRSGVITRAVNEAWEDRFSATRKSKAKGQSSPSAPVISGSLPKMKKPPAPNRS
jgi:hypothetical protein